MKLITRGATGNCPECHHWHKLFFVQLDQDKRKLLMFCDTRHRVPRKIFFPYESVGAEEYIIQKKEEFVFIKEGFKIIKKSEYENPKLF